MRTQSLLLSTALLWVACTPSSPAAPGADAGAPGADAGAPGDDAGASGADAGASGDDAGAPGDDAGAPGDEQVSGERLKIRALVNDDGSVIVDEEIIDTGANGAVCRPKRFSDGSWRCQPVDGLGSCTDPPAAGAVTLAIEEVPIGDGLVARRFRGADGSRLRELSYFDLDHQTEVVLTGVHLGGSLDMPPANLTPLSVDDAQIFFSESLQDCRGCAADLIGIDGCRLTDTTAYVRRGAQVFHTKPEDVLAYSRFTIEGELFEQSQGVRHVLRLSAPSALDQWKQADRVLTGAGRYRIAGWQIGGTQRAYPPVAALFDSVRQNESCWNFPEAGGGFRCLPLVSARIVYLDAACSTPAMGGEDGGNAPSIHYAEGFASVDGGPPVSGIWLLGAGAAAPKLIYEQRLGGCLTVVPDARVQAWQVFPLGAQVPETAFGTLHEALR